MGTLTPLGINAVLHLHINPDSFQAGGAIARGRQEGDAGEQAVQNNLRLNLAITPSLNYLTLGKRTLYQIPAALPLHVTVPIRVTLSVPTKVALLRRIQAKVKLPSAHLNELQMFQPCPQSTNTSIHH